MATDYRMSLESIWEWSYFPQTWWWIAKQGVRMAHILYSVIIIAKSSQLSCQKFWWRVSFPAFWAAKQKDSVVEMWVWWHWELKVLGYEGVVQRILCRRVCELESVDMSGPDPMIPLFLSCCLRSWMFLLRQRQEQSCQDSPPHAFRKVTFRETLFPPNPKHTALFFPGSGPEMWVFTWEGSCTLPEATVTLLGQGVQPTTGETLCLLSNNDDECTFGFKNTHTHTQSTPLSNTHRCACVSVHVIQIFHSFVG